MFINESLENPISDGIRLIGVGKMGSRNCSIDLSQKIVSQIHSKKVDIVQKAAFLTALFLKQPGPTEIPIQDYFGKELFESSENITKHFFKENSEEFFWVNRVLGGKDLSLDESYQLGLKLFDDAFDVQAKAMISTFLRMKHAVITEYEGILKALLDIFLKESEKKNTVPELSHEKISWQISEPFDGLERSYLMSPLLGQSLIRSGHQVFYLGGASSGPKFGVNICSLFDLNYFNEFQLGQFFDIENFYSGFEKWRKIRRSLIKRPFMATIEKYFNPLKANVLITSVFHGTFKDKGNELVQKAGFKAGLVVFRGLEGSVHPSMARGTRILGSFQKANGEIIEKEFESRPEHFGFPTIADNKDRLISKEESQKKLFEYLRDEAQDEEYIHRAQYFIRAFEEPVSWIVENYKGEN